MHGNNKKDGGLQLCGNICDFSGMETTQFTKSCRRSHWLTDDMTYDRLHVYVKKREPFGKRCMEQRCHQASKHKD